MEQGGWVKGAIKNPGFRKSFNKIKKKEGGSTAFQNNGIDEIGSDKLNMFTGFISDNLTNSIINQETENMMDPKYFQFGGASLEDFGYGQGPEAQMNVDNALQTVQNNQNLQANLGNSFQNFANTLGEEYGAQAAENEKGAGMYDQWRNEQARLNTPDMQAINMRDTNIEAANSNRELMPAMEFGGIPMFDEYGGMITPEEYAYMYYGGSLPKAQDGTEVRRGRYNQRRGELDRGRGVPMEAPETQQSFPNYVPGTSVRKHVRNKETGAYPEFTPSQVIEPMVEPEEECTPGVDCAPGETEFSEDNPTMQENGQDVENKTKTKTETVADVIDKKKKEEETITVPEDTEDTTVDTEKETDTETSETTQDSNYTQSGLPFGYRIDKINYGRGFLGLGKPRLRKLKATIYGDPKAYALTFKAAKQGNRDAQEVLSEIQEESKFSKLNPFKGKGEEVYMPSYDGNYGKSFEDRSDAGKLLRRPRQAIFGDKETRQARRESRRFGRRPGAEYGEFGGSMGGYFQKGGFEDPIGNMFAMDNYGDDPNQIQGEELGKLTLKEKKMGFQKSRPGAVGMAQIGKAGIGALTSAVNFAKENKEDIGSMTSADKVFRSTEEMPMQKGMDYTFNPMGIASSPLLAEQTNKYNRAYVTAEYGGEMYQEGGEYEMSDAEIAQFMAAGGQIEYVD